MSDDDRVDINIWLRDFFFGTALYAECELPTDAGYRMLAAPRLIVDGHCPHCRNSATFHRTKEIVNILKLDDVLESFDALQLELRCTRDLNHKIVFILRFEGSVVQKIGQYPSFADIAVDQSKTYKTVLEKDDTYEFHKAIGLAAHGVGIGSFV